MADVIREEITNEIIEKLKHCGYDANLNLLEIIGEEKVRAALSAERTYKSQPFAYLFRGAFDPTGSDGNASQIFTNTAGAIRIISRLDKYKTWLNDKTSQACDVKDYENASAALVEIRTLGSLLNGFSDVDVIPESKKKTTDFLVNLYDGQVYVETTTKQMNEDEAKKLEDFHNTPLPENRGSFYTRECCISPAGKNTQKEDGTYDTTAENVASKLANLKTGSKQVKEGSSCIIWIDLQDQDWWVVGGDCAFPIVSGRGAFTTIGVWHSFYGIKGTPLFDNYYPFQGPDIHVQSMRFDGRFHQKSSRFCCAALNIGRHLVLYDNPNAINPLTDHFWMNAAHLSWFDFERSIIRWPAGLEGLKQQIELQRATLDAFRNITHEIG